LWRILLFVTHLASAESLYQQIYLLVDIQLQGKAGVVLVVL
jgi:hypothetical protein